MTDAAIDSATFAELKETAGGDFIGELIEAFLAEAPKLLDELTRALAASDADAFRRAAHSLKSNSNTFGARTLGAMARELELKGMAPVIAANAQALYALAQEYARVAAALVELRDA